MTTFSKTIIGLSLSIASVLAATPALADMEPASTAGHGSVAALLGYGFKDGIDFGLGLRGGYTLPVNVYLGGTFMYHFGKSEGNASVGVYYLGFEGGYDFAAGPVIVRPYLGLGPAIAHSSFSCPAGVPSSFCGNASGSDTKFGVWPGVTVLYPIDNFFVGGDARFLVVDNFDAFSLFLTGGIQF